jgi:hypothetical protein
MIIYDAMATQELEARVKDIANTRLQAVLEQADTLYEQLRTMKQLIHAFYDVINDKMPTIVNVEDTEPFYTDHNGVQYYMLIRNGYLVVKSSMDEYTHSFEEKYYPAMLTRLPSFIQHVQTTLTTIINRNKAVLEQYSL